MPGFENPATRLKTFMNALRPKANTGTLVAEVCAEALGLTWPDDHRRLLRRLADVADLAHEVRVLGGDPEHDSDTLVLLADYTQVEQVVQQLPAAGNLQMSHCMNHMTDAGWRSLDLAELLLSQRHHQQPVLDTSVVQRLLEQIRSLIDDVALADDLDEAAKVELVRRLRSVEEALLNVAVTGTTGVEMAAEALVGHVVNQPPERRTSRAMRLAAEVAKTTLLAAAAAAGAMAPQLATGEASPPVPPPAVVIIDQVVTSPSLPSTRHAPPAIEPRPGN